MFGYWGRQTDDLYQRAFTRPWAWVCRKILGLDSLDDR